MVSLWTFSSTKLLHYVELHSLLLYTIQMLIPAFVHSSRVYMQLFLMNSQDPQEIKAVFFNWLYLLAI